MPRDGLVGREHWLVDASTHCSERERRAESAEREAQSWKKFVYLSKRVGEEFDAYVSAVVPFGLFITLEGVYADGLLPMDALEDDFYRYEDVEHPSSAARTSASRPSSTGSPAPARRSSTTAPG